MICNKKELRMNEQKNAIKNDKKLEKLAKEMEQIKDSLTIVAQNGLKNVPPPAKGKPIGLISQAVGGKYLFYS
jgi:hypothetical protein